ncbi:MAG: hypothetical protein ACRDIB_13990 [Ardenticatenaceae bacterium]
MSDLPGDVRPSPPPYKPHDLDAGVATPDVGTRGAPLPVVETPAGEALLNSLRVLRAEIQDLQAVLDRIRAGDTTVAANALYFVKTLADVTVLMERVREMPYDKASRELFDNNDTLRHIRNHWELMRESRLLQEPAAAFKPEELLSALNLLDALSKKMIFLIARMTIPARIKNWQDKGRVEYYLPFHAVFEDELPDPDDRRAILNLIAWAPGLLDGAWTDPESGLIYYYEKDPRKRDSALKEIAVLGFAILLLLLLSPVPGWVVPGWPIRSDNVMYFIIGWFAVLSGMLFHVVVHVNKRRRTPGALPPVIASGDLPIIASAKKGQILLKLALSLVAVGMAAFSTGEFDPTFSLFTAFLIGYSLDSVIGLVGDRLDTQAEAQATALRQQWGIEGRP